MIKLIVPMLAACVVAGCASTTRTFDISVHNATPATITLWLTKDGPPAEEGWLTTEQFVAAPADAPSPGVSLPAGKTAETGKVKGKFPAGTNAILLIYRTGQAAARPGGSEPLTIRLTPGRNEMKIVEEDGKLLAKPPDVQ